MNIIRTLNHFFIHEPGEQASFSEYFLFYGHLVLLITLLIVFTTLNITF